LLHEALLVALKGIQSVEEGKTIGYSPLLGPPRATLRDSREVVTVQARAISCEAAERVGYGEDAGGCDLVQKTLKLAVHQTNSVERLQSLVEVLLERSSVPDVRTMFVVQVAKLLDEPFFELQFRRSHSNLCLMLPEPCPIHRIAAFERRNSRRQDKEECRTACHGPAQIGNITPLTRGLEPG